MVFGSGKADLWRLWRLQAPPMLAQRGADVAAAAAAAADAAAAIAGRGVAVDRTAAPFPEKGTVVNEQKQQRRSVLKRQYIPEPGALFNESVALMHGARLGISPNALLAGKTCRPGSETLLIYVYTFRRSRPD